MSQQSGSPLNFSASNSSNSEKTTKKAGSGRGLIVVFVAAGVCLFACCGVVGMMSWIWLGNSKTRQEAERKHQEELKAILSKTTTEETKKFLGGLGPVKSPEKAREFISKRLDEWRSEAPGHGAIQPPPLLFARLLEFKIIALAPKGDDYLATVNLRVELSGGPGMIGGGPTADRQVRYAITKDMGAIRPVD